MAYTPFLMYEQGTAPGGDQSNQPPPGLGYDTPNTNNTSFDMGGNNNGTFDFTNFMKQYLTNGNGNMSSFIPAMATAMQQWNNANQYKQLGQQASSMADPFGDRSYYKDRLRQSYDDPSAILNDPGHKIQVQRGLDNVASVGASKGYLGSGNMAVDLSKYASDSDATYLDAERKQLGNLAGAQFDPANAANMLMKGGQLSVDAQNAALGAMFTQFNNKNSPDNGTGKNVTGRVLNPEDLSKITDPIALLKKTFDMGGPVSGAASNWIRNELLSGRTVDPNDPHVTEAIYEMNQGGYLEPDYDPAANYGYPTDSTSTNDNSWYGGGSSGFNESSGGLNWDNPEQIDWSGVDFNNFTDTDWGNLEDFFG